MARVEGLIVRSRRREARSRRLPATLRPADAVDLDPTLDQGGHDEWDPFAVQAAEREQLVGGLDLEPLDNRVQDGRSNRRVAAADLEHDVADAAQAPRDLGGRAVRDRPSLAKDHDAIAEALRFHEVVGGDDDRPCLVAGEGADQLVDVTCCDGIERRGRLVQEQHLGVVEQRASESEALLHATAESRCPIVGSIRQPEALQDLVDAPRHCGRNDAKQGRSEAEVLTRAEALVDRWRFGQNAGAGADLRTGLRWIQTECADPTSVCGQQAVEDPDRGGLARPVVPEEANDLAGTNDEGESV
jgi:hypothetical protein